jgi:ankyrin repeat protein
MQAGCLHFFLKPNKAYCVILILLPISLQGHAHVTTWLVENGADVTAIKEDDWKDTVLHYAAANGHSECVEVLLSVGANPTETNFEGATPADLARKGGYGDLAKVLIEAAADWVRRDSFRMVALQMKEEAGTYIFV